MSHWPYYRFRQSRDGAWSCSLAIPTVGGYSRLTMDGDDPVEAFANAARLANAIAEDPIVSALLPPQAKVALRAADYLARKAARGELSSALRTIRGEGARRLGRAISRLMR